MRKKPLRDTEVLFNNTKKPPRTSAMGDASLDLLPRAPERKAVVPQQASEAVAPQQATEAVAPQASKAVVQPPVSKSLLQRAGGDAKPLEDRVGLQRAYDQGDSYTRGDTMYVAGSNTWTDWGDDVSKIPFWGDVRKSTRYEQADKMLKANPQVHTIVGHSLGGSVAHQLQSDHPGLKSVTYGSPSISWGRENRFRNAYDVFSVFDRGATQSYHPDPLSYTSLTHDYHNFKNTSSTDGSTAQENPDGTVSITE
jgi:hypothetical protein